MNTNIVISLDTRRKKKDGTYPLVMRLGHNERTTSIPLGISIEEKDWDAKARNVRSHRLRFGCLLAQCLRLLSCHANILHCANFALLGFKNSRQPVALAGNPLRLISFLASGHKRKMTATFAVICSPSRS